MSNKEKKRLVTMLAACAVALCAAPGHANDNGAPRRECSVAMLRGLYLFKGSGFNLTASGATVPKAIIESIRFNGDGTLVAETATVTVLGAPPNRSQGSLGTYTVLPDCTGTITFSNGPAFDTFVSSPLLLSLIQTAGPGVLQGDARFVSR